ncbi:hypothetical protein BDR07DRAFT_1460242 [Suillus spraguei]|nr:hypothetical protein BDR07DRAFT_1460242 [Suillus spraguei]
MLEDIWNGRPPSDDSPETFTDSVLNALNYKDFPALRHARAKITVNSKDKKLDVIFRSHITAMLGTLNLYLDPELSYGWREASLVVSKSRGQGINHAHNICTWIHQFLHNGKLPFHQYGQYHSSILEDEDFAQEIQLYLSEVQQKEGHIRAQDIVDYVATPNVQERLGAKAKVISKRTAQRWLCKLDWRYGRKRNGMYIDGHERPDVVEYRNQFIQRWQEYEKRMFIYDNDGNIQYTPKGFPVAQTDSVSFLSRMTNQLFMPMTVAKQGGLTQVRRPLLNPRAKDHH